MISPVATRVLQILSDFVRWRWAPFVGLVGASLFYVLFAILLIPSQVGASEQVEEEDGQAVEAPETSGERGDDASQTDAQTATPSPVKHIERSSPLPTAAAPKRRGFSPPLERPDPTPPAPPAPPPPPEALAQPAPAPIGAAPAPDPASPAAAEEQQRLGAAAAARAATLAATRASRLSGRGLRPRLPTGNAADPPVHEESEVAADDEEEESAPAESDPNAQQAEAAEDGENNDAGGEEPAEAEAEDE